MTDLLVQEVANRIGREGVIDIFNSLANRLMSDAPSAKENQSFEERLDEVIAFLREKGFIVEWEIVNGQYVVYHMDCPYRQFAQRHREVCVLDEKILETTLDVTSNRISCIACQDDKCAYVLTNKSSQPVDLVLPASA